MDLISKLAIGAGLFVESILPSFGQDNLEEIKKKNYSSEIGISVQDQKGSGFQEYFGSIFGIYSGMSKEIVKELEGGLHMTYSWEKNKKENIKINIFEIGPTLEWHPTFGDSKWFYAGAGFKYKSIEIKDTKNSYQESVDGIGLAIVLGGKGKIGKKGAFLDFKLMYDNAKGTSDGYELELGATQLILAFGF